MIRCECHSFDEGLSITALQQGATLLMGSHAAFINCGITFVRKCNHCLRFRTKMINKIVNIAANPIIIIIIIIRVVLLSLSLFGTFPRTRSRKCSRIYMCLAGTDAGFHLFATQRFYLAANIYAVSGLSGYLSGLRVEWSVYVAMPGQEIGLLS